MHSCEIWCIGPLFEEKKQLIIVTSDRYVETFLELRLRDLSSSDMWFQQDGATTHTHTQREDQWKL